MSDEMWKFFGETATQEFGWLILLFVFAIITSLGVLAVGYAVGRWVSGSTSITKDVIKINREATLNTNQVLTGLTQAFEKVSDGIQALITEMRNQNGVQQKVAHDNRTIILDAIEDGYQRHNRWATSRHSDQKNSLNLIASGIARIEGLHRVRSSTWDTQYETILQQQRQIIALLNSIHKPSSMPEQIPMLTDTGSIISIEGSQTNKEVL